MSSLNEKGRKRVVHQLKALTIGYIHRYLGHSRQNINNPISDEIIKTCSQYIDPSLVWIAMKVFIRFPSLSKSNSQARLSPPTSSTKHVSADGLAISSDSKSMTLSDIYDPDDDNVVSLSCHCNHIFTANARFNDIFRHTGKPLIDALLSGFNTAFISYGHYGSGAHSTLFGTYRHDPLTVDISSIDMKREYCLIADDGIYQRCMKYLLSELQARKLRTDGMNWELTLQHIYTYPDQQLLDDALVNKHVPDDDDPNKKRRNKRQSERAFTGYGSDGYTARKPLKIKQRKAFDERTDTKIVIQNARSVNIRKYTEIKQWWQVAHDNIFASQLRYAKVEQSEAKSNYNEFENSINQIISLDLSQYLNDGTILESNVKFVLPKYYAGHTDSYQKILSNESPSSHSQQSQPGDQQKYSLYPTFLLQDPLYTACNALNKDLMPRYRENHFTYLCKDVLGGNCKTCVLLNCCTEEEHRMHLVKCIKFAQILNRVYCNPKLNAYSIREWSRSYDALKYKYDTLRAKMNEMSKQIQQSKRAKTMGDAHLHVVAGDRMKEKAVTERKHQEAEYRDDKKVVKQGHLSKEGGVIKSVKVRYFVLFQDGTLAYYDDVTSKNRIGTIDLKRDFKSVEKVQWLQDESHNFHGFVLTTKQRAWKLGTGSVNTVNEWVQALQKATEQK